MKDLDLSPEEKEMVLQRIEEKREELEHPFRLGRIEREAQGVFNSLLPTIVGRIQVKRLQTRNEMIREMRHTLTELAETKKAYERLRNIDAEIAVEQMLASKAYQEKMGDHEVNIAKSKKEAEKFDQEREANRLKSELEQKELRAKIKGFEEGQAKPKEPEKSEEEKLREKIRLEKLRKDHELEMRKKTLDFEKTREKEMGHISELNPGSAIEYDLRVLEEAGVSQADLEAHKRRLQKRYLFNPDDEEI